MTKGHESVRSADHMRLVESTKGFHKLTDYQKSSIMLRFLVQDQARAFNPREEAWTSYRGKSMAHMQDCCCFEAVQAVENELPLTVCPVRETSEFMQGEPRAIQNFEELQSWFKEKGTLLIGHYCGPVLGRGLVPDYDDSALPCHSFIYLGENGSGDEIVWGKRGPRGLPYETETLQGLFTECKGEYSKVQWWRARPFRTKTKQN